MHYDKGNPSNLPYIGIKFDVHKIPKNPDPSRSNRIEGSM